MTKPAFALLFTATNGFAGTLLGALGSHAWKARLETNGMGAAWQTAGVYHLVHAAASLALLAWAAGHVAKQHGLLRVVFCWQAGCLLFCGSIYALALGGPRALGPVTPLGGLAFLAGWGLLLAESLRRPSSS